MSATSLLQSVVAWLAGTARQPGGEGPTKPYLASQDPLLDTFGNPVDDNGAGDRNWRDVEDRVREYQILTSCWM
jgi:hypothetical protein